MLLPECQRAPWTSSTASLSSFRFLLSHHPPCLPLDLLSWLSVSGWFFSLFAPSLPTPFPLLSLCRLQMENICSLELCNSPFYYFFQRHPGLTLHPALAPVFLLNPRLSVTGLFPHPCAGRTLPSGWHCAEKQGAESPHLER